MYQAALSLFEQGGVMMYPLLLCSLITFTLTVERLIVLRSGPLVSSTSLKKWIRWIDEGMDKDALPANQPAPLIDQLLVPLVPYLPIELARLEERLSDLSRKARNRLERGVVYLDTIAGVAPLLGLLGTALGMVEVFAQLSAAGHAKMEALSSGISQALLTTVAGLLVGIPALIAANLFTRHIENLLLKAEDQVNTVLDEHYTSLVDHENR